MIDLSHHSSWIWIIASLVILFIAFRFFSHIVARILHVMSFLWRGCLTIIVLFVLYFILLATHIL